MSSLLSLLCCCGPRRRGDEGDIDEHTALLNPDILPEAPARPAGPDNTEEQRRAKEAGEQIVKDAIGRIVPILEPAPFSHSLNPSPYSSRSTSPVSTDDTPLPPLDSSTPERPSSLWRPPTSDSPVKVVHLGTTFEPHELSPKQNRKNGKGKGTKASHLRPPSTHSLKTLPRGAKGPSPLGLADDDGEGGEDDDEDDDDDDEDDEDGRYDTYRTAREGDTVVDRTQRGSSGGRGSSNGKTALRDLWSPEGTESEGTTAVDGEEEEGTTVTRTTGHEALDKALKELEDSMDTFTLTPVGPLVADLSVGPATS